MKVKNPILLHIVVWLAVLAVTLPLVLLVIWSFTNRWPMPQLLPPEFSFRGWQRLFSGYFNIWQITVSSIALSLFVGVVSTLIATMAARALCVYSFPGKRLIEWMAMLPLIVPATVFGMGSHMLFIHLRLSNTILAVVICQLISTLPFALRVMLETTRMSGSRLEEQARTLGATPLKGLLHGFLPSIAPGLISALSISFLLSYNQYFLTLLIGGGKVKTLAIIVMPLIEGSDRTVSSVYSMLFIASSAAVFAILQWTSNLVSTRTGKQLGEPL